MKPRNIKLMLLGAVVLLLAVNMYLLYQNSRYRHENRALILQNDSILSVNLELMNTVLPSSTSLLSDK